MRAKHPGLNVLNFQPTVVRALINWQVGDLLEHTRQRLRQEAIRTVGDVRRASGSLVGAGPEVKALKGELEAFLHRRVYRHPRVKRMAAKGKRFIHALFHEYVRAPELLPERYGKRAREGDRHRTVCDYLAGMTDRFAQNEYQKLFHPLSEV
jgi:dGTPase